MLVKVFSFFILMIIMVIGVSKEYCDDKQSCQNLLLELKAGSSSLSEIRRRDLLIIVLKNSVRRIDMAMIGVMDDTKQHEEMENDMLGVKEDTNLFEEMMESEENSHTWLSSVLTSYITCIDEIGEGAYKRRVEPKLENLISRARVVLALFISISLRDNTELISVIPNGPSWLFHVDKKDLYLNAEIADVVVAKDGTGKYSTVNAAIAAAPQHSQKRFVIYIKTGIYDEIVVIENTKPNLTLIGDGQDLTIITGNLSASNVRRTYNTATVASNGNGFIGVDMCFRNTAGPAKGPAVALRVSGDMSVIYRCRVEGYQDALYPHSDRQFYRECFITGTVDFICGNAVAVFQFCQIVARQPKMGQSNVITAQSRATKDVKSGFSIQNCNITTSSDLDTATVKTYLGRPWRRFSTVAVLQSFIGDLVDPAGWTPWKGETGLSTLHYREYQNRGPGAVTSRRVKWSGFKVMKDPKKATEFTVAKLLDGETWLKESRIPYESGL
ncbi:Plant invertase/pectin methylesterase inhibitor superfamily [Arabidopsis thaliana]|uniref:Probable pectinesterase 30 n=1 Tax=Arabidopsis thaliana TaxID=3702 RepID=PME30_ARATH|nr:Plant invertase/pectin methylesterase inhibitor superfamily [Arabidopsis thaliana]Q3EAY9.1 RecName: Full=Probable pectinesterase 30; Short=PE 30; AltName: Full=Pectin methylesterase 30; Short=AtPME30; Flags: Precursor [Arabidopsis thaliana]AEE77389.1 Plant invertase/pectin methylesterase inhibitor superfamily [Arabidopsis thaliana]|eukprot:NP_189437.1 Plant invertase/pectin methylesterase inhibitor superfamily [Arabidopsis thaliana]